MIESRKYHPDLLAEWNAVVQNSCTNHFMFNRGYMDYHADRFEDASLIFYKKEQPVAVLPMSRHEAQFVSHGGLSFGGIVSSSSLRFSDVQLVLDETVRWARQQGARSVVYKAVPAIYQQQPFDADLYLLRQLNGTLCRQELNTVVDLRMRLPLQHGRKYGIARAKKRGVVIEHNSERLDEFWGLLVDNLSVKHDVAPVHSLDEMQMLQEQFPGQIQLHVARHEGLLVAGTIVYVTETVVHTQYIGTTEVGRDVHALDLLTLSLLDSFQASHRYLSFGVSTYDGGQQLNSGLLERKEGFGGRSVVHSWYQIDV